MNISHILFLYDKIMDLAIEPDIYSPNMNEQGNYVDKLPTLYKPGYYCPCGARKDKIYDSRQKMKTHIESKAHQKWLADLNTNKANVYVRCFELEETVKSQQIIIAQMNRQLETKTKTIDILTEQLTRKSEPSTINLLDF